MNNLIKILLALGIHNWEYNKERTQRTCRWSELEQNLVYEGAISGYADFSYWEDADGNTN